MGIKIIKIDWDVMYEIHNDSIMKRKKGQANIHMLMLNF